MIIKALCTVLFFTVIPVLLGMIYNKITSIDEASITDTYLTGYVMFFAFFWVLSIAIIIHYNEIYLDHFVNIWKKITVVLIIAALAFLNTSIISQIKGIINQIKSFVNEKNTYDMAMMLLYVFLIGISIMYIEPSWQDYSVEKALIVNDDNLLKYSSESFSTFPELLFIVGINLFGLGITQGMHLIIPLALLPFFFFVYRKIGKTLFSDSEENRNLFIISTMLFYFVMTFADVYIGITPLQNIWNGTTLTVSCLLPLFFGYTLDFIEYARSDTKESTNIITYALLMLMVLVASQMFMPMGAVMCFIIFICGLLIR